MRGCYQPALLEPCSNRAFFYEPIHVTVSSGRIAGQPLWRINQGSEELLPGKLDHARLATECLS